MTQDPTTMNRFQRNAAKRGVKATERTKSWGAEQKEKALSPADQGRNRFGAPNLRKPVATAPQTLPTVQRTAGGTLMSPELIAARDAEQIRRAQIKADAARPKYQQPSLLDFEAIVQAFPARHSNPLAADYFFNSLWNRTMLERCVAHNVAAGNIGYDSLGLDAAHKVLLEGGYYEAERRVRGTAAPREYPPFGGMEEAQAPKTPKTPNGNVTDSQERARLRTMPLAELAKLARAGYKNPNGRMV
jgi:hypothetical protein